MKTISICIIIKNEEKALSGFLKNIVDFADEIIITDTGSSDNSPNIVKKFINEGYKNIKFYKYETSDGFHYGKAKNFSIKKATKDFIIILDADERLSSDFEEKIRQFFKEKNPNIATVVRIDEALPHFIDSLQERIIKNGLGILYGTNEDNRLHEQLIHNFKTMQFKAPILHCQRENHWLQQPHRKLVSIIGIDVEKTPKTKSFFGHFLRGIWVFQFKFKKIYFRQKTYKDGFLGFKYAFVKAFSDFLVQIFVGLKPKKGYKYW